MTRTRFLGNNIAGLSGRHAMHAQMIALHTLVSSLSPALTFIT